MLPTHLRSVAVPVEFNVGVVKAAIREAQALVPGYTYQGFCDTVKRGGGLRDIWSPSPGRRVLYFGRTGETHIEFFPASRTAVTR